jgi:CRP-like cAMP-binding protein
MAKEQNRTANRLLQSLPSESWSAISPYLEDSELRHRQFISGAGKQIEYVYFPESGLLSVVAPGPEGRKAEVGLIGFEGMSGVPVLLGLERCPLDTFVQRPGLALRIRREHLQDAIGSNHALKEMLLKFLHVMSVQTAYTAFANAHGRLEERLSRWLVMYHDRIDGDELPLVHEFLAIMLAVRRPGVTEALNALEGKGVIKGERGKITILDREGLIRNAGGFYGQPEAEYLSIFEPTRPEGGARSA